MIHDFIKKATCNISLYCNNEKISCMTGFFISRNHVVTTAHTCFSAEQFEHELNMMNLNYRVLYGEHSVDTNQVTYCRGKDIIVLNLNTNYDFFLPIDNSDSLHNEKLLCYSYSDFENPQAGIIGRSNEYTYDGFRDSNASIQLKNGQVFDGFSGSPLVSMRTFGVVAAIGLTKGKCTDFGGYGIRLCDIDEIRAISLFNKGYDCKQWVDIADESHKVYMGVCGYGKDSTLCSVNLLMDDDDVLLKDVFVEPTYSVFEFDGNVDRNQAFSQVSKGIFELVKGLLEKDNYLFVAGKYGTGKTVTLKHIAQNLKNEEKYVYYFKASELINIYKEVHFELLHKPNKAYILIDGLDEVFSTKIDKNSAPIEFLKHLVGEMCKKSAHNYIVSFRNVTVNYEKNDSLDINLLLEFMNQNISKYTFIELDYFKKHQIQDWLVKFTSVKVKTNSDRILLYKDIKDDFGNYLPAFSNPIFLYMFSNHYYKLNIEKIRNREKIELYSIYESFVEKTCRGKFEKNSFMGHRLISDYEGYKCFLKETAKSVFKNNELKLKGFNEKYNDELMIDDNETTPFTDAVELKKDALMSNYYNCYFFSYIVNKRQKTVRFNDNNILYYFITEDYCDAIRDLIDEYSKGDSEENIRNVYNKFLEKNKQLVHPLVCDMLISCIKNLEMSDKKILNDVALSFIQNGLAINISSNNNEFFKNFDIKKINTDILLSIIMIKLNNSNCDIHTFFCKRLDWYVNAAKMLDWDYFNLVRRHYKEICLYQTSLKRLNYKGYNFNESVTKDVKFIQSKICDTSFHNSVMHNTKFILCTVNLDAKGVKGYVEFINCKIKKMQLRDCNDGLYIKFHRCEIQDLILENSKNVIILTERSEINETTLINVRKVIFDIRRTSYSKIKLSKCFGKLNSYLNYDSNGILRKNPNDGIVATGEIKILSTVDDIIKDYWDMDRYQYVNMSG